jgi:amino acid adenylation domain-containing protein
LIAYLHWSTQKPEGVPLYHANRMSRFNLALSVHRHALQTPQALAVSCEGHTLIYAELAARAHAVACALRNHSGWKLPSDRAPRVGIFTSRSLEACTALLGACWAGATYVPINPKQPEARLRAILSQCGLSALVTDRRHQPLLTEALAVDLPPQILVVEDIGPTSTLDEPMGMAGHDTAYIIFTSGTTGAPKGVMIPLTAACHFVNHIHRAVGLTPADRTLSSCEISFDVSVYDMFATWEAGASLHILPANKVMNAARFVREQDLTVWSSVPSLAGMLRQLKQLPPNSLPSLRLSLFGGEQLPAATLRTWREAAPLSQVINLYGPTETTVYCTLQPVAEPPPLTPGRDVVAIGQPFPGTGICIVDPNDQPVPTGVSGELLLSGVQLASGYLNAPELTADRFPVLNGQRWYRSGDAVMQDSGGQLHCLGRIDNQVKVLGYRVELEEIDGHLRTASGIALAGVVAWPQVDGMARGIVGFVAAESIDSAALIAQLQAQLPPYMVPTRIVALPTLPTNANGKVDRRALLKHLEAPAT